jgi:uncharacterized protein YycO
MEQDERKSNKPRKKSSVIRGILAFFLLSLLAFWLFLEIIVEYDQRFYPDYEKLPLEELIKDAKSEEGLQALFLQTGLGPDALKEVLAGKEGEVKKALKEHQENFFRQQTLLCRKITPITGEEKNADEEGRITKGFRIEGMRSGDIFLSFSTHSLGWRHGHSALVTNGNTGRTLEAVVLGRNSEAQRSEKWTEYPTFLQLRISDEALELLGLTRQEAEEKLAEVGEEKLTNVPYGLLTGMFGKYVPDIRETQCSHLVWFAYYELGLDIDSDGGWLVTPRDIAGSPYFDVIQIYGMDPSVLTKENSLIGEKEKE